MKTIAIIAAVLIFASCSKQNQCECHYYKNYYYRAPASHWWRFCIQQRFISVVNKYPKQAIKMYIQPYHTDHAHRRARAFIKSLLTAEDEHLTKQKQALIKLKCAEAGYKDPKFVSQNLGMYTYPNKPEFDHYFMFPNSDKPEFIVSIGNAKIPCIYNSVTKLSCTFNFK